MYDGWREVRAEDSGSPCGPPSGRPRAPGQSPPACVLHSCCLHWPRSPDHASGQWGAYAGVASRAVSAGCTGGRAWPDALAHPISVLLFAALAADSSLAHRNGELRWKGRVLEGVR